MDDADMGAAEGDDASVGTDSVTSVRPPDRDRRAAPRVDDRDPLAGWDQSATGPPSPPPPPTPLWALLAGGFSVGAVVGTAAAIAGHGRVVRRGLAWSAVAAAVATAVARPWELAPETAEWAAKVDASRARAQQRP